VDCGIAIGCASIIGGDTVDHGMWVAFWFFLAQLNFVLGAINLVPLLPFDGGHIAGGIYEYLKRGLYRILGKPNPGIADTALLAPVANAMFLLLMFAGLAMIVVDLVKPLVLG
jgi:Zn-dependent protease